MRQPITTPYIINNILKLSSYINIERFPIHNQQYPQIVLIYKYRAVPTFSKIHISLNLWSLWQKTYPVHGLYMGIGVVNGLLSYVYVRKGGLLTSKILILSTLPECINHHRIHMWHRNYGITIEFWAMLVKNSGIDSLGDMKSQSEMALACFLNTQPQPVII